MSKEDFCDSCGCRLHEAKENDLCDDCDKEDSLHEIDELRRERDEWRARAEKAEAALAVYQQPRDNSLRGLWYLAENGDFGVHLGGGESVVWKADGIMRDKGPLPPALRDLPVWRQGADASRVIALQVANTLQRRMISRLLPPSAHYRVAVRPEDPHGRRSPPEPDDDLSPAA